MRRNALSIGRRIPALPHSSSPFSTSAGGSGRGRGGGGAPNPDFISRAPGSRPAAPPPEESKTNSAQPPQPPPPSGHGRGRPVHPAFYSFVESAGIGRGGGGRGSVEFTEEFNFNLPSSIISALPKPGVGRGKPDHNMPPPRQLKAPPEEENRHLKARSKPELDPSPKAGPGVEKGGAGPAQPKVINQEEAAKNALRILSRKEGPEDSWGGGRGDRRGGRGGEGQRGMGRGRGWKRDIEDEDSQKEGGFDWGGDPTAEERLAKKVGPENVAMLTQAFEEIEDRLLPDPVNDAILDGWETNFKFEFEPEYLMGEFDQNPDIDEKPPMPLADVLEKVKPFMMAYEGIQNQQEWEEAVEETMKRVPLLKEIVDYYSGPDRITAKKQQEELERVAKNIPANAPASVKRFADRAILSLQSNPGWGFRRKYQFMHKLVHQVSRR